jgi:hypothetical protein
MAIYLYKGPAYLAFHKHTGGRAMFQKKSQNTYFSAAVAAGLVATLAVVVATLVDAVAGMQSYL